MNSSLLTKDKILYGIDTKNLKGVEIGPLAKPLVTKDEGDVRYVDRAPTEEIKAWYSKAKNLDLEKIVPVDYVWGDSSLTEATGHKEYFDYCIAAHVIEHVPDLIGWLQEISAILKDKGIASFSVPDRRFTFDYLRPETIIADIIEAYLQKRRKPAIRHIFDHFSCFAEIDVTKAWKPDFDGSSLKPEKSLKEVFSICQDAVKHDKYIDSHCWIFTAHSFLQLLTALNRMNLIDFKISRFFGVEENNHEFVIQLEKIPSDIKDSEKQRLFDESLQRTLPHTLSVEFKCNKPGKAQVYYDTGAGFSERESICQEYKIKNSKMVLEFSLPPMDIKSIRFDPAMSSVNIQIFSIQMSPYSGDSSVIPFEFLEAGENIRVSGIKKDHFFAKSLRKTTDPSIQITLPDSLKGKL